MEQKENLAPCRHKSQIHEAGAGAKGLSFYSDAAQPGRMVDSCLRLTHFPAQVRNSF